MSTRAIIAVKTSDKTFEYIYLHRNGYPKGAGLYLASYYNTEAKAEKLLSLGSISTLGKDLVSCAAYNDPKTIIQTNQSSMHKKLVKEAKNMGANFIYLFDKDNWLCWELSYNSPEIEVSLSEYTEYEKGSANGSENDIINGITSDLEYIRCQIDAVKTAMGNRTTLIDAYLSNVYRALENAEAHLKLLQTN
ncbi:hypothetical protein ACYULU_15975 [Breznakiellaceae bacterium SP9]